MKFRYNWLFIILLGFSACVEHDYTLPDNTPPQLEPGSADFSTYVAVGNSLTAGYSDGALFIAGQQNSFANMVASKMAMAGGGEFTIPFMDDNIGGMLAGGNKILEPRLIFDGSKPVRLDAMPTTDVTDVKPGPYNNMGVPGAKAVHLIAPGYGNIGNLPLGQANPYFVRMASSPNTSVLQDAMAMNPTFFSLWIGNNDVLGYAASGGDGSNPITDEATFEYAYTTLINTLTSGGAKGVVLNIPDVTTIPYFTTVPFDPLDPENPDFGPQIPLLNQTFAPLNQAFDYLGYPERKIVFHEDANSAILIQDESIPNISAQLLQVLLGSGMNPLQAQLLATQYGQCRQAKSEDLIVLPASSVIATLNMEYFNYLVSLGVPQQQAGQLSVNGITYPMRDKWVLLETEQEEVKVATNTFNAIISMKAQNAGLAFVDANALMDELYMNGISSDGFNMTADLVKGGAFSLDGVHLTGRGNAMIAQAVLKAIDATYGSNFEAAKQLPKIGDYPAFYNAGLR